MEQLQGVVQGPRGSTMASAGVAEEDEHPGSAALRRRDGGWRGGTGACFRRRGAYFLCRAAARRAIHRMLYWASRYVMKSRPMMPMPTHVIVRFASSLGASGAVPTPSWFCWMM